MTAHGTPSEPAEVASASEFEEQHADFALDRLEQQFRVYRGLILLERYVSLILIVGVFVLVMLQVVTRYVLNSPLSWSEEAARLCMVWLTFIAAMYVSSRRGHISVDLLAKVVKPKAAQSLEIFSEVLTAAVSVVLCVSGVILVKIVAGVGLSATGLPVALLYLAATVGFAGIAVHSVLGAYLSIKYPEDSPDVIVQPAVQDGV